MKNCQKLNVRLKFASIAFLKIYLFTFYFLVLSCSASNATAESNGCPKGANCIENGTVNGTLQSYCVCGSNFTVNQNYLSTEKTSLYCVERKNETSPTESPPTQATKVAEVTTTTTKPTAKTEPSTTTTTTTATTPTTKKPEPTEDKNEPKIAPAPGAHHLLGGILLPIMVVLAFIGGVFAIRKYDLIERAHGFIRNRNQQTRYNGLMENDFDDDPLLI